MSLEAVSAEIEVTLFLQSTISITCVLIKTLINHLLLGLKDDLKKKKAEGGYSVFSARPSLRCAFK